MCTVGMNTFLCYDHPIEKVGYFKRTVIYNIKDDNEKYANHMRTLYN